MAMPLPRIVSVRTETFPTACREAAAIVRQGGVVAVPTESFYALGCDPKNPEAVARVRAMKGRPSDKAILVLLAGREQVMQFAQSLSPVSQALMDVFWPGPLTLLLPALADLPAALTAGTGAVGLRWSAHPDLQTILTATGPLTGTSANRSGEAPSCLAEEVARSCGAAVDLILDLGPTAGGPPSTLLDVTARPRVLREGAVPTACLREMLARFGETLA
jgi:L-threonylcarbamoyladenylate synthase